VLANGLVKTSFAPRAPPTTAIDRVRVADRCHAHLKYQDSVVENRTGRDDTECVGGTQLRELKLRRHARVKVGKLTGACASCE
jgi:hypothetical protein